MLQVRAGSVHLVAIGYRISLVALLVALLAGCSAWRSTPTSRLHRGFSAERVRTVAVVVDAGNQSRVPAEQVMNMLRLMLLHRGYRSVLLPSPDLQGDYEADALLSVACGIEWQTARMVRGAPTYMCVVDIPRITVVSAMRDLRSGRTLLSGRFREGGVDAQTGLPPATIEEEWPMVARGLAATLRNLPSREVAPAQGLRSLRVLVAADEEYRRQTGWERLAKDRILGASRMLGLELGIVLKVIGVREWASADQPRTLAEHMASMMRQVPTDSADVVIGLTGQTAITPDAAQGDRLGVSEPFGRSVLVRRSGTVTGVPAITDVLESVVLAREMAHLFGALRAEDLQPATFSRTEDASLGFDDRTRQIVTFTRNRNFGAGEVLNVVADSLRTIYRQAGPQGALMLTILERGVVPGD